VTIFLTQIFTAIQCIGSADTLIVTVRKSFISLVLLFSQILFLKFYSILHDLFAPTHWLIFPQHKYVLRVNLLQLTQLL